MTVGVIQQALTEVLDWSINWANRGLGSDAITSSSWASSDPSVTLTQSTFTGASTTIWVQGTKIGRFTITNTIGTSGNREMVESLIVNIIPATQKLV